ncbi:XdhC family protein [Burkholderia gladioli]|uniref:XdhC family protein n=1 Tax=Burkholderia gladioli TaxID=28095 RepID=UPI001641A6B9|nr:XdhC family protein [Burkholderia gladioli]
MNALEAFLARRHAPIGLYLGGGTPPEIAVSIVADLTARRHRVPVAGLRDIEAGKAARGAPDGSGAPRPSGS